MTTSPPNLPDARTAQRLLDILAQLEQSLRMGRQSNNSEVEGKLANLQFENQRLRSTRQQASQRLGALMERLTEQAAAEGTSTVQEDAA